mmetsp:Transcript_7817/g.18839  ORF Transcript_7817/g.18839 Transcript_7817/m.18839 type:complete len:372 (+) Transcript_7817:135-1250(+)
MEWGCIESIRFAPHRTIDMVRALMRDASSSSLEYSRVLVGIPHKVARDHRGGSARGGGHLPEGPFVVSIGEVEKKGLDEGPGGYQNNRCLNDAEGGLYKGPPDQSEEKGEDHSQKRHQNIGRVGAGILRWNLAGSWLWFFRCLLRCVLWGIGSGRGGLFLRSGIRSWWFLRFLRLRLLLLLLPFARTAVPFECEGRAGDGPAVLFPDQECFLQDLVEGVFLLVGHGVDVGDVSQGPVKCVDVVEVFPVGRGLPASALVGVGLVPYAGRAEDQDRGVVGLGDGSDLDGGLVCDVGLHGIGVLGFSGGPAVRKEAGVGWESVGPVDGVGGKVGGEFEGNVLDGLFESAEQPFLGGYGRLPLARHPWDLRKCAR